jgi:hypothetical protein
MSRQHRHRDQNVKKMHAIIGDYAKVLDDIGKIPGVKSVITGSISLNKSEFEEMTFQYFTDSGLKLLAKTTEAVQEIFLVCADKNAVLAELRSREILQERVRKVSKKGTNKSAAQKPRTSQPNRRDARYNASDLPKDAKPTTLKDMLSPEMLAKLTEQSNDLKEQERVQQENKRQADIDRRAREQKELESNFEYLLNNSKIDWKNFKD